MATNRNPESQEQSLAQLLSWHFEQLAKGVNTAAPGVVESYDPATKRARVRPALRLLLTSGETINKPAIIDVPVIHPAGGGYIMHFPLGAGDTVLLIFSQRGIENFKKTFQEADPPPDALFAERDAIALPGFGALPVTPAGEGCTLQSEDGSTFVEVHSDRIRLRHGEQDLTITDSGLEVDVNGKVSIVASGEVVIQGSKITMNGDVVVSGGASVLGDLDVDGPAIRHAGTDVGMTHTHGRVEPGAGSTGPAQ